MVVFAGIASGIVLLETNSKVSCGVDGNKSLRIEFWSLEG
jgi:hypothetical protein